MKLTFDGSKFNVFHGLDPADDSPTYYVAGTSFNSFRGTLNISTDSYSEYVNQTKITQNTNMQIAKQEMQISVAKQSVSGLSGFFGNLFSGNFAGAIGAVANTGVGIADTIRQYNNNQKQLDAANMTARNTAGASNIQSSVTSDDILNKMGAIDIGGMRNRYPVRFTKSIAVKRAMFSYWLNYGWICEEMLPLGFVMLFFAGLNENEYYNNDWVYFDIEINDDKYVRLFKPNANVALINVINTLNKNSFRIWRRTPYFNELPEVVYTNISDI